MNDSLKEKLTVAEDSMLAISEKISEKEKQSRSIISPSDLAIVNDGLTQLEALKMMITSYGAAIFSLNDGVTKEMKALESIKDFDKPRLRLAINATKFAAQEYEKSKKLLSDTLARLKLEPSKGELITFLINLLKKIVE